MKRPIRVGWFVDAHDPPGGAELSAAEFRAAVPEGVRIYDCSPDKVVGGCDIYVLHNHMTFTDDWELHRLGGDGKVVRYHHDVREHPWDEAHGFADVDIFCSPVQLWQMGESEGGVCIPPALSLDRFREAERASQGRSGAVCAGAWMNPGKSPHLAQEWAEGNGGITFIGQGPYAPPDSVAVPYEEMPETLAQFKTFVYLPTALEPFGRTVVEAWASGCDLVLNRNVGARYWIEEEPEALEAAGENFWNVVLAG